MDLITELCVLAIAIVPSAADDSKYRTEPIVTVSAAIIFLIMLLIFCCWSCEAVKSMFTRDNRTQIQVITTISRNRVGRPTSSTASYPGYSIGPPAYSDITDNYLPDYDVLFPDQNQNESSCHTNHCGDHCHHHITHPEGHSQHQANHTENYHTTHAESSHDTIHMETNHHTEITISDTSVTSDPDPS